MYLSSDSVKWHGILKWLWGKENGSVKNVLVHVSMKVVLGISTGKCRKKLFCMMDQIKLRSLYYQEIMRIQDEFIYIEIRLIGNSKMWVFVTAWTLDCASAWVKTMRNILGRSPQHAVVDPLSFFHFHLVYFWLDYYATYQYKQSKSNKIDFYVCR